jgi:hypothetical protein
MDEARILFRSKRFTVTDKILRTPRKTYALQEVDYVQVKRPLLMVSLALGALLLAWAGVFWDLLYSQERTFLVAGVLAMIAAASRIGTLVVHSLSLHGGDLEDAIIWDIGTVRAVRVALDETMLIRGRNPHTTAIRREGGDRDER